MGKTFILWIRTLSGKSGEDMDHPLLLFLKNSILYVWVSDCVYVYALCECLVPEEGMDPGIGDRDNYASPFGQAHKAFS